MVNSDDLRRSVYKFIQCWLLLFGFTQNLCAHTDVWEETEYVWHFGLAHACNVGLNSKPREFFQKEQDCYIFNSESYRNIRKNDIVWVRCRFIPQFSREILPYVQHPFTIVISAGDESFPTDIAGHMNIEEFIEDDKILHIFAQNCDYTGPSQKVSGIPIGIDFHTIAYNGADGGWGERGSPGEQEESLNQILDSLLPTSMRIARAFVDFQHSDTMHGEFKRYLQFGEDRKSIFQKLQSTGLIDFGTWMRRTDLWKTKGQYAFSISPHGNGLDCHRTWEDLVLGCIVIVKKSALDPLYKDLPVVIVKDWAEVTQENMNLWLAKYGDAFTNSTYRQKLTNQYWLNKIRGKRWVD